MKVYKFTIWINAGFDYSSVTIIAKTKKRAYAMFKEYCRDPQSKKMEDDWEYNGFIDLKNVQEQIIK